ncbi:hypothetical protein STRDD11_02194 [Streptococcus sp. DD11]|nr:hypothetical protein STRDD11_02194 [Streptococcus sp. DD11]
MASRINAGTAERQLLNFIGKTDAFGCGLQDLKTGCHDFRTDPVTSQRNYFLGHNSFFLIS